MLTKPLGTLLFKLVKSYIIKLFFLFIYLFFDSQIDVKSKRCMYLFTCFPVQEFDETICIIILFYFILFYFILFV